MAHFSVSITVDEEDDTLDGAVQQAREDIRRLADRGTVTVRNVDEDTTCQVESDGEVVPFETGSSSVVLVGNPGDGFRVFGPFDSGYDVAAWADSAGFGEPWFVLKIDGATTR